jgi:hypothetical protein
MKEKTLLKIAFASAIIGIIALFVISRNISIEEKSIEKINSGDIESDIKITGTITKIVDREKVMIIDVAQPKTIQVLVFKDGKLNLSVGQDVQITGEVRDNEEGVGLVANEIRVK